MIINQTIHIELAPEAPKIIDGYWYEWVNGEWVNTGRKAEGEDGYSVSLSKSEHTFNYDKNGNLKGLLSDGVVSVEVMKGTNALMCDSLGVLSPTVNDTYRVTSITQSPTSSFSYNVDRPNNVFRLVPVDMIADEVEITFTIVARSNDVNTTFTRKIKYQKHRDGSDGVPGADGFTVGLSKSSHTYVTDSAGNIKGAMSSGAVTVWVRNGNTIFSCPSTSYQSIPANGEYVVTYVDAPGSLPLSFSLSNNQFVLTPTALAVIEARVVVSISAKLNNIIYYFTAEITYNKVSDGEAGLTGDGVVHIYKQYPTKPSTPSSGVANPTGWSRNPDYILSIVSQTNWAVNGKWHQSEELTAIGNSTTSKITFTTAKDAQTITLELWADGHATYDYVYAGNLDSAVSTSNYSSRVRGGRIIVTYDVPTAGSHYIDIFWRKGIATIVGSNRGYYAIISNVKVWRSATNVIGGVYQNWSVPEQFLIDTSTEERIYCLSKTTDAPLISDSDAFVDDYIPLPCTLSSYRGDFTTYRAYSVGQVVVYLLDFYKVVKAVNSTYTGDPTNTEYFEKIKSWTDNPTGANKEYPYEIIAIRKKVDGLWGQWATSVWSNFGIGTNYIPMGWWNTNVTYSKTDLGIPMIKKADGTALGYSVYTLKVAASTPGSFILSEWDLVESADFIYMQQAYIERLQAEIVTADSINAMDITSRRVLAIDANDNKIASMNEYGDGAYIQYYPSGRKRMEFGGGLIIYYSDNALNTELWTLGQSGSISSTTLDRWSERYLVATDTNGTNVKKQILSNGGIMYKEFKAGSGSTYTSYNGLTVKNTVNNSTTPNIVSSSDYIPYGWYTAPVIAMRNQDDPPYTFRRTLVYYSSGKIATSKEIIFTDYGDGLPTE